MLHVRPRVMHVAEEVKPHGQRLNQSGPGSMHLRLQFRCEALLTSRIFELISERMHCVGRRTNGEMLRNNQGFTPQTA